LIRSQNFRPLFFRGRTVDGAQQEREYKDDQPLFFSTATQEHTMNQVTCATVGIDIAKDKADICAIADDETRVKEETVEKADYAKFVRRLKKLNPKIVVLEATGGYENDLLSRLCAAQIPVRVINPARARHFADAIGKLAKTDRVDAYVLALFALRNKVEPQAPRGASEQEIRELCDRRQQLVAIRQAEKNRAQRTTNRTAQESIERLLDNIEDELDTIDAQLDKVIDKDGDFKRKQDLLVSIPGIAKTTARTLLSAVPELGTLGRAQAAALVGLAPFACDSGKSTGDRVIRGGRLTPRNALYMAAMSAMRFNPRLKKFYQRLRNAGKAGKLALIACARKLLLLANALLKKNQQFSLAF
jgi:transposase